MSIGTVGEKPLDSCGCALSDDGVNADPAPEEKDLTVNNSNIADVANNADVTSLTGNNSGTAASGSVVVDTGNTTSIVNVLNIINTNIVGSDVHVLTLDLMCTENADIARKKYQFNTRWWNWQRQ